MNLLLDKNIIRAPPEANIHYVFKIAFFAHFIPKKAPSQRLSIL